MVMKSKSNKIHSRPLWKETIKLSTKAKGGLDIYEGKSILCS